jgi:hypothetical protein
MKTNDLVEILKVYAGVKGLENLQAMLSGQLTIEAYLKHVIEGANKDLTEKRKKLRELPKDSATEIRRMMLAGQIADVERVRAFAQGYLAATKGKKDE